MHRPTNDGSSAILAIRQVFLVLDFTNSGGHLVQANLTRNLSTSLCILSSSLVSEKLINLIKPNKSKYRQFQSRLALLQSQSQNPPLPGIFL